MSILPETVFWYDKNAAGLAVAYEAIDSASLHAWLDGLLPAAPALVLDVGAGTGRDAACGSTLRPASANGRCASCWAYSVPAGCWR
jgi:hypothetical protein